MGAQEDPEGIWKHCEKFPEIIDWIVFEPELLWINRYQYWIDMCMYDVFLMLKLWTKSWSRISDIKNRLQSELAKDWFEKSLKLFIEHEFSNDDIKYEIRKEWKYIA